MTRLEHVSCAKIKSVIGENKYNVFSELNRQINELYQVQAFWFTGGKKWSYECKLRKKRKTICSFLFKNDVLGFMIIFGKDERSDVEDKRHQFSNDIQCMYDDAMTYRDGKWVLYELYDNHLNKELLKLLEIKKP